VELSSIAWLKGLITPEARLQAWFWLDIEKLERSRSVDVSQVWLRQMCLCCVRVGPERSHPRRRAQS
jgi:hypothetical protein